MHCTPTGQVESFKHPRRHSPINPKKVPGGQSGLQKFTVVEKTVSLGQKFNFLFKNKILSKIAAKEIKNRKINIEKIIDG